MRVLVTGMGGELGSRVAQLLEDRTDVDEIVGLDFLPPRRRLRRSRFRRLDLRDRDAIAAFVAEVDPDAVVHLGVYEPHARTRPADSATLTSTATVAVLGAAGRSNRLSRVVLRSGIEVYGRRRGLPGVPDEDVTPEPATLFGRMCLEVETVGAALGRRLDIPVAALRLAPVVGSHVPSPLGRVLRLPVVPVAAFADPPFCMVHVEDAARAFVAAVAGEIHGPVNVVAAGAATPWQAVRLGGRVPCPVAGTPAWRAAARLTALAGAPLPEHVGELLRAGRAADGTRGVEVLGMRDAVDAPAILTELFEWASIRPLRQVAVA